MDDRQWASVEAHFDALRDLSAQERAAGLAAIVDNDVRGEVASLLDHAGPGSTVTNLIGSMAAHLDNTGLREERIGPYRLTRRLGQGGQGAVFEALRDDGSFEQRVAIKIVKWDVDSEDARCRFRDERQMLARLQHPFIARLLDGGQTADGTPYIVMEFVEGQPLNAATEGWPLRRKLELFLKVMSAVAFAHRSLIVHRDLKPANILVAADGTPRLLDFGIAKLLDADAQSTLTAFPALTPDYASPEQVRGEAITTASDVYSLGVVLYRMLTGRKPYALDTATPLEMDRIIGAQPPSPPDLGEELDHILLMALRKEPERRYHGVEQFAEDIQRYLDRRPVLARPDTLWYRARKYARRHWIGLAAASVAAAAILGGTGVAVYQARIAQRRFNDVRQLANSFLFEFDDQIATVPGTVKAQQMLVDTALRYLESLSRDAGGDLSLQRELAQAYGKVGALQVDTLRRTADATVSYGKALAIYQRLAEKDPQYKLELGQTQAMTAWTERQAGDLAAAIASERAAVATLEGVVHNNGSNGNIRALAKTYDDLSILYDDDLNDDAALETIEKCLRYTSEAIAQMDPPHAARLLAARLGTLQIVYLNSGQIERAMETAAALDRYLKTWLNGMPNDADALRESVLREDEISQSLDSDYTPNLGDTAQALPHLRAAQEWLKPFLKDSNDPFSREFLAIILRQFSYLHRQTSVADAVREGQQAIALFEQLAKETGGQDDASEMLAHTRLLVADHISRLGRAAEARGLLETGLKSEHALAAKTKGSLLYQRALLRGLVSAAATYRNLRDPQTALATGQEAADLASRLQTKRPHEIAVLYIVGNAYAEYGLCLLAARQMDQAHRWFEKDASLWRNWPKPNQYVEMRQRQAVSNLARSGGLVRRTQRKSLSRDKDAQVAVQFMRAMWSAGAAGGGGGSDSALIQE